MSTTDDNNDDLCGDSEGKKVYTSREQNNVDTITEGIDSMAIQKDMTACAACGKVGNSDDMNTCNK